MINVEKLMKMQAKLDKAIVNKFPVKPGEDRFIKTIAALQVELAEMMQETRCFKYWSVDKEPRNFGPCKNCLGKGKGLFSGIKHTGNYETCIECNGSGKDESVNPILEEYADVIHFTLSLGNEIGYTGFDELVFNEYLSSVENRTDELVNLFIAINYLSARLTSEENYYEQLLFEVLSLGEMLGFTWEQVEQSYIEKNKENYRRMESNY